MIDVTFNYQEQIQDLSKRRDGFLQIREDSWNPKTNKYEVDDKEIDKLGDQIFSLLKIHKDDFPLEFIIEQLTKLGHAPNLLYDDNGHFALVGDGYQSIADGISDVELQFFVEKENWKNSVREALNEYLDSE